LDIFLKNFIVRDPSWITGWALMASSGEERRARKRIYGPESKIDFQSEILWICSSQQLVDVDPVAQRSSAPPNHVDLEREIKIKDGFVNLLTVSFGFDQL
jgi:hypothetical protein